MQNRTLTGELGRTSYPGRGIILGMSGDGQKAVIAYFIMGRSENSRNRIFVADGEGLKTKAYDESRLVDPSLIIYAPVRTVGKTVTVVTNGDQTDTVADFLQKGRTFEEALRTREFEPDAPNYTPRISGIIELEQGGFSYTLSILKSDRGNPDACLRFFYEYAPVAGQGHFIHTYEQDGDPLPSFEGEPELVAIESENAEEFAGLIWDSLNEENKVSLFVRYIDLASGDTDDIIINKHN